MTAQLFVALSTFGELDPAPRRLLERSGFPHRINTLGRRPTKAELIDLASGCVGVIAGVEPYDDEVLSRLPDLRCISRCGVGVDNIALDVAAERGITVKNTPDVVVQPVAEMTVAMMFDLLRRLSFHTTVVKAGEWRKEPGRMLARQTVGLIGLGRIGRRVAELLVSLGARVIGCDPRPDPEWAYRTGIRLVDLNEVLRQSDIVSLHLAISAGSAFILGRQELARMKEGALLVNVARGHFVDETALCDLLATGQLGGAALDVFVKEPYAGRLCGFDNVVLTPHVATLTHESRTEMEMQATQNLIDVMGAQFAVSASW